MSEKNEESPAQALMRKRREKLFGHATGQDVDIEEVEEEFAQMQRENHHLRVWIDALQLSTYSFIRQKVQTSEETALFHGNILMVVRKALLGIGATEDEIDGYMFGEAPEDDAAVVYAIRCTEFAEKALEVTDAMVEMHNSADPIVRMQREVEAAQEEERKRTAN